MRAIGAEVDLPRRPPPDLPCRIDRPAPAPGPPPIRARPAPPTARATAALLWAVAACWAAACPPFAAAGDGPIALETLPPGAGAESLLEAFGDPAAFFDRAAEPADVPPVASLLTTPRFADLNLPPAGPAASWVDWANRWGGAKPEPAADAVVTLLAPDGGELELTRTSLLGRALASRGRLRADALTDFSGTTRFGGQLVATTWLRAALDAEAYSWKTDAPADPDRRLSGDFVSGDANIVANVVSHPRGTARTGLGAAWVVDDAGEAHFGPQGTVALDANLLGPATAGFEIDLGQIGDDDLFRWRAEFGWVFGGAEVRTGYDKLSLGDEDRGGWFASFLLRY